MKIAIPAILLFFGSLSSYAQDQKTTVYCTVTSEGQIDFWNLANLLPDSVKAAILEDPRKEFNLRDAHNIMLWMTLHGWKIVCAMAGEDKLSDFVLSREVDLDAPARALLEQRLETTGKK